MLQFPLLPSCHLWAGCRVMSCAPSRWGSWAPQPFLAGSFGLWPGHNYLQHPKMRFHSFESEPSFLQILQILSMNITNRMRAKRQPGQSPNLRWKPAWVYADAVVILVLHALNCSLCLGPGTVIWEIVAPADPFGGRRRLLPERRCWKLPHGQRSP